MIKAIHNPWIWIAGMAVLLNMAEGPLQGAFANTGQASEVQAQQVVSQAKNGGILMPSGNGGATMPNPLASPTLGPVGILMPSGIEDGVRGGSQEHSIYQEEEHLVSLSQEYTAQCSFCHAPKAAKTLPDLAAWIKLLYTSGCPQVTIKLDDSQRRAIKTFIEAELKNQP